MANIWIISDTHFGHANTFLKFKLPNGQPMRPFTSISEMDETMIARWNTVVRPQDKVYHLGDVLFEKDPVRADMILSRLMGHKRLILGNHDDWFETAFYMKHFEKVLSSRLLDHMLMTHIPVHPNSIHGKCIGNVHGHLHNNDHRSAKQLSCPPYLNVCVEVIDYTPISLDECRKRLTR